MMSNKSELSKVLIVNGVAYVRVDAIPNHIVHNLDLKGLCPYCGEMCEKHALLSSHEWFLYWTCNNEPCSHVNEFAAPIEWPYGEEEIVTAEQMTQDGFEVV